MNVHGILKPPQNDQAHNGDNHQSQKEIFLDEENGSIVEDVEDGTFIGIGFGATITHTITALDIGDDRIYAEYAHVHQQQYQDRFSECEVEWETGAQVG